MLISSLMTVLSGISIFALLMVLCGCIVVYMNNGRCEKEFTVVGACLFSLSMVIGIFSVFGLVFRLFD